MSSSPSSSFGPRRSRSSRRDSGKVRRDRRFALLPESLEERVTPTVYGYTVPQIRGAYGINSIPNFGSAKADGTGQAIALVIPYNDPTIVSDLDDFDQAMSLTFGSTESLYQLYGPASSFFTVYNQTGQNITADLGDSGGNGVPADGFEIDTTIGVEWSHALAPGAKIDLVEANDETMSNKFAAVTTAANLPGVSVVVDDDGDPEFSGETSYDSSTFATPPGHTGVTFVGCAGNQGYGDNQYEQSSPNVIDVGGTQLTLNSNFEGYGSEVAWSYDTPRTINNGSALYSQSGPWTSQSGGFSGTYSTAAGGSAASASWPTTLTPMDEGQSGGTEVSATWTASPGNATNATYTIYDGPQSSGMVLGTVTVDQTKAPVGTPDGNFQFQELGYYFPTSGKLTIVLNANTANGTVVADAVGVAPLWASTGGQAQYEVEPSYQRSVQSTGFRTTPDVAFNASENSPVDCYQNGVEGVYWGTTPAAPSWASLIAIVNQGRVAEGAPTLNGVTDPTQALQALYSLPSSDYHDITSGYTGIKAGPGYDETTGLGSPIANLLVPDMVNYQVGQFVATTQPPASVTAGSPFGLTITVETDFGATITSYNGSVTLSLANNPGGGKLNGTLTVTAFNGVATFSGLTLDKAGQGYEIEATTSIPSIAAGTTNSFNVLAGPAAQLVIYAPPPPAVTAGEAFGMTVAVEDSYDNVITNDKGSVTLALLSGPVGSVLGGTLTEAEVNGVANFPNLTLNKVSAGDTLGISRTGLPSATIGSIAVLVGAPAQLAVFKQPPSGATAGVAFGLEVAIEDAGGNIETTDDTTTVVASLLSGAGTLLGTTTATDSGGIATFTNLIDDKAGPIVLQFSGGTLSNTSSSQVVISPSTATQLVIHIQPSSTASAGLPFATQPVIYEEDQYNNIETGDNSTVVTASLLSGAGPLQGTTMAVVSGGVATFKNLADTKVETISLAFSGPNLKNATSNSIIVNKPTATVAWSASAASATYMQSITLTATVAAPIAGGPIPTGSVTFLDGSTVLHTSTLNSQGQATFSTASLPLGTQAISVAYSGSPTYASSTSSMSSLYVGDLPNSDYDGDGKSDIAIFDQTTATFYIEYSGGGTRIQQLGNPADKLIPVAGDYTGDGKTDLAIYDQTLAEFFILYSNGGSLALPFGNPAHVNIPVAGDFDGDGKTDIAIYDQTAAIFYVLKSGGGSIAQQFGNASHVNVPIAGDFDGDGKTDLAIYDQTAAIFYALKSGGGSIAQQFGNSSHLNVPIAADFDGDGKTDLAIYDRTAGVLYALESGGGTIAQPFGNPADVIIPLAGDFDGDGKTDIAIYDQTAAVFFILDSDGGSTVLQFGNNKHANQPV
jgi:hypothetical protein